MGNWNRKFLKTSDRRRLIDYGKGDEQCWWMRDVSDSEATAPHVQDHLLVSILYIDSLRDNDRFPLPPPTPHPFLRYARALSTHTSDSCLCHICSLLGLPFNTCPRTRLLLEEPHPRTSRHRRFRRPSFLAGAVVGRCAAW